MSEEQQLAWAVQMSLAGAMDEGGEGEGPPTTGTSAAQV